MSKKPTKKIPASVCWFEIPADDTVRAKKFYASLFGWSINPFPTAAIADYHHIDTGGADASPDGAIMPRMHPQHTITAYISVPSVTRGMARVAKLGGTVCKPKTAVPGLGYFAICTDTENNAFALWEANPKAQ